MAPSLPATPTSPSPPPVLAGTRNLLPAASLRSAKPPPSQVIVLAVGSRYLRYNVASSAVPRKLRTLVAFPRRRALSPPLIPRSPSPPPALDDAVSAIAERLALDERRRGGGKPAPWRVEAELVDVAPVPEEAGGGAGVLVGRAAERAQRGGRADMYDFVAPMRGGRVDWGAASAGMVRAALDVLLGTVGDALLGGVQGRVEADTHVVVVVGDRGGREEVAEIVAAVFRAEGLRAGAVFVHHDSVACALGAGLSTCVVVDFGAGGGSVACVEEGCVVGESRVRLRYGAAEVLGVFEALLLKGGEVEAVVGGGDELKVVTGRVAEQVCGFGVEENDTLAIVMARGPSGRMYRVKVGAGVRAVPAYGMVYPELFLGLGARRAACRGGDVGDNVTEGLFDDIKRSAVVSAAVPFGVYANDAGGVDAARTSVVDAVVWSVRRAVEASGGVGSRGPELLRRYFNSVLLAGGGSSLDGVALALESELKGALARDGVVVSDVTIIDGAKGKGDEELAAASALVRNEEGGGLDDDGDPASLPWKGGAVIVEGDAVKDYWLYRDEWDARGIRALREKLPFYW